jgi:hypothetical protein
MGRRGMCTGEANYFRDYKRLGVIAKLATSYFAPHAGHASLMTIAAVGLLDVRAVFGQQ